jgi:hypothetical protein
VAGEWVLEMFYPSEKDESCTVATGIAPRSQQTYGSRIPQLNRRLRGTIPDSTRLASSSFLQSLVYSFAVARFRGALANRNAGIWPLWT